MMHERDVTAVPPRIAPFHLLEKSLTVELAGYLLSGSIFPIPGYGTHARKEVVVMSDKIPKKDEKKKK